jgi:hypothetical protein
MKAFSSLTGVIWFLLLITHANASPKVTQAAIIDFKTHLVTALAVEEFSKSPSLIFFTDDKKKEIIEFKEVKAFDEFAYTNSFLRFKSFRIKGIALPLIVGVAAQPTGTDEWAEVKIISERNGTIAVLNPDVLTITLQDGIYLGYINKKYGYGMVKWNFQWDAAHYEPHKYEISISIWDRKNMSFVPKKTFITKKKFKNGCAALKHYGLPCNNIRDQIIKVEEDISTLGIEDELHSPRQLIIEKATTICPGDAGQRCFSPSLCALRPDWRCTQKI